MSRNNRHHFTSRRLGAVALVAAVGLTGCGSDGDDSSESTAPTTDSPSADTSTEESQTDEPDAEVPDLCTLFSAEDFLAVTGETAGEPESTEAMGAVRGTCTISAEAGFPMVMLAAYNESDREATLSMVDAEPAEDLGREAYWDETLGFVVPLEGKDWYLQVYVAGGDADREDAAEVAEMALGRLEG